MPLTTTAAAVEIGLKRIPVERILVATDFSQPSNKAVHFASALARAQHAKLYLAHVVSAMGFTLAGPDAVAMAEEVAGQDLCDLEQRLVACGELAGVEHQSVVCHGRVWEQLGPIIQEEQIDLVVIGTHGRTGLRKLVMGSVAEEIFRHAPCPVMTVGPQCQPQTCDPALLRPILFPTDLGIASAQALPYAIALANHNHARLTLLHVLPPLPVIETGSYWYVGTDLAERRQTVHRSALERLQRLLPHEPPLIEPPEFLVAFGFPPETIVRCAIQQRADLIVLGVRAGSGEAAAHLPWAIADEIVCRAECPVLTLRA